MSIITGLFCANLQINLTLCYDSVTFLKEQKHYDVGSTFREDIIEAGLKVENRLDYENFFKHYEGSSWRMNCGNEELERIARDTWNNYQAEIEKYKSGLEKSKPLCRQAVQEI